MNIKFLSKELWRLNKLLQKNLTREVRFFFDIKKCTSSKKLGHFGISIGSSNQANGYWYESDSKIDDIRIYNRALSSSEVLYLNKR